MKKQGIFIKAQAHTNSESCVAQEETQNEAFQGRSQAKLVL